MMRFRLRSALPCFALTPAAGVLGVMLDQHSHCGLSTWISLCRGGTLPYTIALWLQLNLMPLALCLMLTTALLSTLSVAVGGRPRGASRNVLAGHLGCVAATLIMPLLCPPLVGAAPSVGRMLGTMASTELTLTMLIALLVLRALAWHETRRHQPVRLATGS